MYKKPSFGMKAIVVLSVLCAKATGLGIQENPNGHNNWFEIIVEKQMGDKENEIRYVH